MSEKEEEPFQSSNICWICKKLIDGDNEKVGDHCHVTYNSSSLELYHKSSIN